MLLDEDPAEGWRCLFAIPYLGLASRDPQILGAMRDILPQNIEWLMAKGDCERPASVRALSCAQPRCPAFAAPRITCSFPPLRCLQPSSTK